MQRQLNLSNSNTIDRLIDRIAPNLPKIMNDSFGNYFSKNLIQCCTAQQRLKILQEVRIILIRFQKTSSQSQFINQEPILFNS